MSCLWTDVEMTALAAVQVFGDISKFLLSRCNARGGVFACVKHDPATASFCTAGCATTAFRDLGDRQGQAWPRRGSVRQSKHRVFHGATALRSR